MARKADPIIIGQTALLRLFGIQREHLKAAQVQPVDGTKYDLNEVLKGCDHVAAKHFAKTIASEDEAGRTRTAAQLKADKTAQEVRKLTIENDLREGRLVKTTDVFTTYAKHMKALTDRLDAIPARVKVAVPDISQAALDEIQRVLAEGRNSAVMKAAEDHITDSVADL